MTLTEFLLARIAEDEAAAREAEAHSPSPWACDAYALTVTDDAFLRDANRSAIFESENYSAVWDRRVVGHIARHDPVRVLAECEAKRRIVGRHVAEGGAEGWMDDDWLADMTDDEKRGYCGWCTYDNRTVRFPCADMRDLASVYAGRPDYREEWKP